jgi:hypothetical protein
MSAPPAEKALREAVATTLDATLGHLRRLDPDAAAEIDAVRRARPAFPSIVLIGETGRGKSALAGVLLDSPGIAPIETPTTWQLPAPPIAFRFAEERSAVAELADGARLPLDAHTSASWPATLAQLGPLPCGVSASGSRRPCCAMSR